MLRPLINKFAALPAALAAFPALAQATAAGPNDWHPGWDWGWGHMAFGLVMMVLFWGGLILVVILAVRWLGGRSPQDAASQESGSRSLDILEKRFARGEIDKEEFEERRRLLSD